MWGGCCHLVLGNALIGIAEAILIRRFYLKSPSSAVFGWMIGANYLSAALAVVALILFGESIQHWIDRHVTIHNVGPYHVAAFLTVFVLTFLFEWPFVYAALGPGRSWLRSVSATLAAQSTSYAIITAYYAFLSPYMLWPIGPLKVAQPRELIAAAMTRTNHAADQSLRNFWVYYVPHAGRDVERVRLDGSDQQSVVALPESGFKSVERLFARQSALGGSWDLYIELYQGRRGSRLVLAGVASDMPHHDPNRPSAITQPTATTTPATSTSATVPTTAQREVDLADPTEVPSGHPFSRQFGDYRSPGRGDLEVDAGFWPAEGLYYRADNGQISGRFALDTPFLNNWATRYPFVLPGDLVVYQLGSQIVLLDLRAKRIALLARGRGLVVIPADLLIAPDGP
jgi:hypothetical protein